MVIQAKFDGRPIGDKIKIGINPVFYWRNVFHQHGPNYFYDPNIPHAPTSSDYNYAWRYVVWKYGIDTSNLSSIEYDPALGTAGLTNTITNAAKLGDGAFGSENVCASTIGHENVHGGQGKTFRIIYPNEAEVEAYQWELDNATRTGLEPEEIADVEGCRDYYKKISGSRCGDKVR